MNSSKNKNEEKMKYERIVKLVQKAGKEAAKFVQQNKQLDPQLRLKYTS